MTRNMSSFFGKAVAFSAIAVTLNLSAETAPTTSVAKTAPVISAPSTGIIGSLDIRPTWSPKNETVGTENVIELGYQFNRNTKLILEQDIATNVYNPNGKADESGLNPQLDDSIVKAKFDNIWTNASGDLSFSYEPRVYLPIKKGTAEEGMVATMRNYFKVKKDFSKQFSVIVAETPFIYLNNYPANSKNVANKTVGNRLILELDFNLTNDLVLAVPMWWQVDLNRELAGATHSRKAMHGLVFWPEIDYSLTKTITVGVAYRADVTLSNDDASKNGVDHAGQFVFNARL